ncbi:MAG: LPS export ABC transporter permease LptF [Pseudomonadota bacterium]
MLYRRALLQELSLSSGASLVILVAIALVTLFIRLLGEAARGELANEAVFAYLGFSLLHFLPVLLTVAMFIGAMLTLMRYWRDNEMVIWLSSGLSPAGWVRPMLAFALPMALILLLLTNTIIPWAANKKDVYRTELLSRNDASLVVPGIFAESQGGDRVYFVEGLNPLTGTVRNVFMQSRDSGRPGVVVASEGAQKKADDGTRFLVLSNGRRYEGEPGQAEYRIIEFDRYWIRLDPVEIKAMERRRDIRQQSTAELWASTASDTKGELAGRLNVPISLLVLAMLAIPLSPVNNRAKRSYGLLGALLVFFIYHNLMSVTQTWIAQGQMGLLAGMLLAHLPAVVAAAALYAYRLRAKPFAVRKGKK